VDVDRLFVAADQIVGTGRVVDVAEVSADHVDIQRITEAADGAVMRWRILQLQTDEAVEPHIAFAA
jgi:hypothetical protein